MPRARISSQLEQSVNPASSVITDENNEQAYIQSPNRLLVTQAGHGFTVPASGVLPVYKDDADGDYKLAQANDSATLHSGFVVQVVDANTFWYQDEGFINVTGHGLADGLYYYLDEATAGDITTTEPNISAPVAFIEGADHIQLIKPRPVDITAVESPVFLQTTADITYTDDTQAVMPEIGTANLPSVGTYRVTWNVFASRTNNANLAATVNGTNITVGAGHIKDHNSISRVELGQVENNIQLQTNNEPQLIKIEIMAVTNATNGSLTLSMAQQNADAGNPHTISTGSFVYIERLDV